MLGICGNHFFTVRTLQKIGIGVSVKRGLVLSRQKKGIDQRKGWSKCAVDPPAEKGPTLALCNDGSQKPNQYWEKEGSHVRDFITMGSKTGL